MDAEPGEQPPDAYEVALRWSAVDLDAVRDAMPGNLYWRMSAPTSDEELICWREEERARWNQEYGKVLSGNATEEEIEGYYAHLGDWPGALGTPLTALTFLWRRKLPWPRRPRR
jgi:hypothetical protein